jgi:uncharacterized protein
MLRILALFVLLPVASPTNSNLEDTSNIDTFITATDECLLSGLHCPSCKLYMAPSKILGFGRGIIAGRDFNMNDIVDEGPSITVANEVTEDTILNNYIYSSENDAFGMITFGPAMIFNHQRQELKDVDHTWAEYEIPTIDQQLASPNSDYSNVINKAVKNITVGEEIFTSYGDDDWFTAREIELKADSQADFTRIKEETRYSIDELSSSLNKKYPCISDVYFAQSHNPDAGRGLFASRDFKKGEIVTVSPILAVPAEAIEDSYEDSIIVNYCFSCGDNFDFVLFPLGLLAMANHASRNGTFGQVNMRLAWYNFHADDDSDNSRSPSELSIKDITESSFSVLDVSVVATRDISAGDELLLNYGYNWEKQWKLYERDNKRWEDENSYDTSLLYTFDYLVKKPQFRFPIDTPPGFCPSHWEYRGPDVQFLNGDYDYMEDVYYEDLADVGGAENENEL